MTHFSPSKSLKFKMTFSLFSRRLRSNQRFVFFNNIQSASSFLFFSFFAWLVQRDELREIFNDISSSSEEEEDEGDRHEDEDLNIMDTEDDLVRQLQDKLNESDSTQNESDRNSQIGKSGFGPEEVVGSARKRGGNWSSTNCWNSCSQLSCSWSAIILSFLIHLSRVQQLRLAEVSRGAEAV